MARIGIIGGSGLEDPKILKGSKEIGVSTPYGEPSSKLSFGIIKGKEVVIISRHGKGHTISPTKVNYRANIWALKNQGCTHILATTACGSLRKDIGRGDFVILDQFIDFTRHRPVTFFEDFREGVNHTAMADPFDKSLCSILMEAGRKLGLKLHEKGTVVTIEGPRFSTRAESRVFRGWGADVINMSIAPEAILANELGIPYAAVAMATDYDCLFDDIPPVTWEDILKVFKQNAKKVTRLLIETIPLIK